MNRPDNIHDFYLYYLSFHQDRTCRLLHLFGMILAFFILFYVLMTGSWQLLLLVALFYYGLSWCGHIFFEHNKIVAFRNPIYEFIFSLMMIWHILIGRIDEKLIEAKTFFR